MHLILIHGLKLHVDSRKNHFHHTRLLLTYAFILSLRFTRVSPFSVTIMTKTQNSLLTIKSSLKHIEWKDEHLGRLQEFVLKANKFTEHSYGFIKYIFLAELESDNTFQIKEYLNVEFFVQVYQSLAQPGKGGPQPFSRTLAYRELIEKHIVSYRDKSKFIPERFPFIQQTAMYESRKIFQSYDQNIAMRFGQHLRRLINHLLDIKNRRKKLQEDLKKEGKTEDQIKKALRTEIYVPASKFKEAISRRPVREASIDSKFTDAYTAIKPILNAYPEDYEFEKDSLYYDVKANQCQHFYAFYQLALLCEKIKIKSFNCFPLRRSWIPCYITIDTKILCHNILGRSKFVNDKPMLWTQVLNLNCTALKSQRAGTLKFIGMVQTGGVGVSIIKSTNESQKGGTSTKRKRSPDEEEFTYIHTLSKRKLNTLDNRCVIIDPNRRDLLFCMHESSTKQAPAIYMHVS